MSATMSKDRKDYLKEYKEKNVKRIPLDVSHEMYTRILQHAGLSGRSVNGYIKYNLDLWMKAEDEYYKSKTSKDESVKELFAKIGNLTNGSEDNAAKKS